VSKEGENKEKWKNPESLLDLSQQPHPLAHLFGSEIWPINGRSSDDDISMVCREISTYIRAQKEAQVLGLGISHGGIILVLIFVVDETFLGVREGEVRAEVRKPVDAR